MLGILYTFGDGPWTRTRFTVGGMGFLIYVKGSFFLPRVTWAKTMSFRAEGGKVGSYPYYNFHGSLGVPTVLQLCNVEA